MNRLTAVAAVLLIALAGLWVWGAFHAPGNGEWADSAEAGKQPGGTLAASRAAGVPEVDSPGSADRDRVQDPTEETASSLVVQVFDNFGRAVEGAAVWRWREPEAGSTRAAEAAEAATDAQGRACLASSTSPGGIVVLARRHPVVLRRLSSLTGEHEVRLQAGARVQGWIRVDGSVPAEPIPLRLYGRGDTDPLAELPDSLRRMVWPRISTAKRTVKTTPHGAFEFPGLEKDWKGAISLPAHLWFRGESLKDGYRQTIYRLEKPQTGLQLETTLLPGVRGRVVWDDTGQGVETHVHAEAEFAGGASSGYQVFSTDEQGCFRMGFGPEAAAARRSWANGDGRQPICKITVDIAVPGARHLRRQIPEPESLGSSGIELRLVRANMLHFRVLDIAGRPLAGAALKGVRPSKPTDADGRGMVEVKDLGRRRFLAAAPGHRVAEVEARTGAGTPESPLEFRLAKGNKLVVVLRDASDRPPRDVYLSVRSTQPLATGSEAGRFTDLHRFVGTPSCGENWGLSSTMDFWFRPDDTGAVVLASLRPNVPFQLVVVDKLSQDALVQDAVTPAEEKVERIELRLQGEPRDLTGLVVDEHDRPIPGARVAAMFGNRGRLARTDSEGAFRLEGGYPTGNTFTLDISHRGYVRTKRKGLKITADLEPIKVRLLLGHDVEVTFVDADGVRLPVTSCRVNGKFHYQNTQLLEPGLLLLKDQPPEPLVLSTSIGGRSYELRHHPGMSKEARFVLPAMGRLQVEAPRPSEPPWHEIYAKITARSAGRSFSVWFSGGNEDKPLKTRESLLLPGKYTVQVRTKGTKESAGGRLLHPPKLMTVKAGEVTLCRFGEAR